MTDPEYTPGLTPRPLESDTAQREALHGQGGTPPEEFGKLLLPYLRAKIDDGSCIARIAIIPVAACHALVEAIGEEVDAFLF